VVDADKLLVKIRAEGISSGSIRAFPLNLTSLKSVREFAAQVLAEKIPINILINNGITQFAFAIL
jgi:NAD(P)-dependent dehydrogenase (short-subunit alcohol dehydrogenase family)